MDPLVKGTIIGFSVAAPVGPVALLCIRRSLRDGGLVGFVSGLGAATADAFYGMVAAFSLTAITHLLVSHRASLQLFGGLFLLYLGVQAMRTRPPTDTAETRPAPSLARAYFSTLALTATSPGTILGFIGIFAGLGVGSGGNAFAATRLVVGVFLGSAAWWLILTSTAGALGGKLHPGRLRAVNLAAGLLIIAFGLWQLAQYFGSSNHG